MNSGDPVGTVLWPVWRGRAATSPGVTAQARNSEEKISNSSRGSAVCAPGGRAGQCAGSVPQAVPRKHAGAGRTLGIEIKPILVRGAEEIRCGLCRDGEMASRGCHRPAQSPARRIVEMALKHRLPSFAPNTNFSAAGGLMSYSADQSALYREMASFVDKIIKGRRPADLPVQLRDQIPVGRQSEDRQRARPHAAADAAHPRRPGDRIEPAAIIGSASAARSVRRAPPPAWIPGRRPALYRAPELRRDSRARPRRARARRWR